VTSCLRKVVQLVRGDGFVTSVILIDDVNSADMSDSGYSLVLNPSVPVSSSPPKSTASPSLSYPFLGLALVTVSIGNSDAPAVRDTPAYPLTMSTPLIPPLNKTPTIASNPLLTPANGPESPFNLSQLPHPYKLAHQPDRTILRLLLQEKVDPSESSGFGVGG
jgi:hypothetical protein